MASETSFRLSVTSSTGLEVFRDQIIENIIANPEIELIVGHATLSITIEASQIDLVVMLENNSNFEAVKQYHPDSTLIILLNKSTPSLLTLEHRLLSHHGYQVRSIAIGQSEQLSPEQLALVLKTTN